MAVLSKLPKSPITGIDNVSFIESLSAKQIIELYQDQENINVENYFENDSVFILRCNDTGYRFYYPFEIIGDKAFYENLQIENEKKGEDYDREWADDHKFAAGQIKSDKKLLEIGCGSGKFLERISDVTKNVAGLELNSLAAKSAIKKGFEVKVQLIEDYCKENISVYDIVCAFQVLEHISDIKPFIGSALKLLKPNGKLIFSVPNNDPYFQRFSKYEVLNLPPHHMGLWNLNSFSNLEKFYDMKLETFAYTGDSGLLTDAYLRAKMMAKIKSLPRRQTFSDKLKTLTASPFAVAKSAIDYSRGKTNSAYISVVFRKT